MIIRSIYFFAFFILVICFDEKQLKETEQDVFHIHPNLGKERCMRDLGCFKITKEFFDPIRRPINVLPHDRALIDTRFTLYKRERPSEPHKVDANKPETMEHIDPSLETKIIIHGWIDKEFGPWQERLKDRMLLSGEFNVIIVDWTKGNQLPYTQATANCRVVGAEVAYLVNKTMEYRDVDPGKVHIIGHSLGAQIAGYAGERIRNLGRITGLDPAEPYFQYMPRNVRLDETDAKFVDILHTDSNSIIVLGFGLAQPCGHVDFYPNDGRDQPGCEKRKGIIKLITEGIIEGGGRFIGCSHQRAVEFYAATVTQTRCDPVAYECPSWSNFLEGKCTDCGQNGSRCAILGEKAIQSKGLGQNNLKLYVKLGKDRPYCLYHFKIVIKLHRAKNSQKTRGKLKIEINGEEADASQNLNSRDIDLVPGSRHVYLLTTPHDLGRPQSVTLIWSSNPINNINPLNWFKKQQIHIKYIQMVPMNVIDQAEKIAQTRTFCQADPDKPISSGKPAVFIQRNNCL